MQESRELDSYQRALQAAQRPWRLLIDGTWQSPAAGAWLEVVDPASGAPIARAPAGTLPDVDLAVQAARRAFAEERWMRLGGAERGRCLNRVAELLEANTEKFQAIEMLNCGVPPAIAHFIVKYAADCFRYYAGWCGKVTGSTIDTSGPDGQYHTYTGREPAGVAALIVPWNGPLGAASMKLAPALAAGCSCVLKPSEETPLSAILLGELTLEAGIPPGVVNIVTGRGHEAGAALAAHADVDAISFTGSTQVGKLIAAAATGNLKKVSLELGGKSPVIICEDADLDRAIVGAAMGTFFMSGQICVAGSRVYIQRSIFDRVVAGITELGRGLKMGGGFDPTAQIGPLISARHLERVSGFVESARQEGAEVHGGGRFGDRGFFFRPTVVTAATPRSRIVREEVFGPVIAATAFDDAEEVLALANDTQYGLAAAIWTRDLSRAHRLTKRLQAGIVWINCQLRLHPAAPFGGFKQSGWGREFGPDGLDAFTQTKTVMAQLA